MQTNIYRQKLVNAVVFFAKNTKHLNKTKLSKLLYFLDFEHFNQTGYPSIGLEYYAFPSGPLPQKFWAEIKEAEKEGSNVPEGFEGKLKLFPKVDGELEFRVIEDPDLSIFTPREIEILEELASKFKYSRAWELRDLSHLPNQPWDRTVSTLGSKQQINYLLALDTGAEGSLDVEEAKESLKEFFEDIHNFDLSPTR